MRALISVYDKTGIDDFARKLITLGYEIISSGGTAKFLSEKGIEVTDVAEITGLPPVLGHRVVTLHPAIFGGLLATEAQRKELRKLGWPWIDLLCADFYPLRQAVSDPAATRESVIENTDIGGPAMVRAAAKGRRIVIVDPADRQKVVSWIKEGMPDRDEFITNLVAKAESIVANDSLTSAHYHSHGAIGGILGHLHLSCKGENGWQQPAGAFTSNTNGDSLAVPGSFHLEIGEKPSAINWFDLNRSLQTATHIAAAFELNFGERPKIAIGVKHGNPCGVGIHESEKGEAIKAMLAGDPLAIFGGFVLLNFPIQFLEAEILVHQYLREGEKRRILDGIAAPSFTTNAIEILSRKGGKCRLLANSALAELNQDSLDTGPILRTLRGGFILEPNYTFILKKDDPLIRIYRPHSSDKSINWKDIILAWTIGSTSTSNTITLVKNGMLLGNGVGQQDRVACAELAVWRAKRSGHDLNGAVAYSDSFFPFPDGPLVLAEAGVNTIFTSSGSIRDQEIIKACLEKEVTLIMYPDAEGRGFCFH